MTVETARVIRVHVRFSASITEFAMYTSGEATYFYNFDLVLALGT